MMKKVLVYLILPVFLCFVVYSCVSVSASAAPVVTVGEALTTLEILDLLEEYDLVDLDTPGLYFKPSIYLRMVSNVFDAGQIPVEDCAPFLAKILDVNNELFWRSDGAVVQEHNGELVPVSGVGDLWLTTGNMGNSLVPYNYVAQTPGIDNGQGYEAAWIVRDGVGYPASTYYTLPLCTSGNTVYMGDCLILWMWEYNDRHAYQLIKTRTLENATDLYTFPLNTDTTPFVDYGYFVGDGTPYISTFLKSMYPSVTKSPVSTPYKLTWLNSITGDPSTLTSGDMSYLYYTSEPALIPNDMPPDNYVFTTNPDDSSKVTVISPDGEFGNLWDYIANGFVFTGSVDVQGDYNINADLHYSGSLGITHGGDITINFNDDMTVWADDGKSTDFGNGVSLDGNAFNDGFQWLLSGVAAVPVVLQQFNFVPAPVLSILTSALVVMVFLGLWRTFKGG